MGRGALIVMHLSIATDNDIAYVRANLRESSRQDLLDAAGGDPMLDIGAAFDFGLKISRNILSITTPDNRCAGIGSTCDDPRHPDTGFVWFMGTDAILSDTRSFLQCTREAIVRFYELENWHSLTAFVSSHNSRSFRWMTRWLLFEHIGDSHTYARATNPHHELRHMRSHLTY